MTTKHKVNIFQVLGNINKKDQNFYTRLSDEEKKAIHPLVIMRWMSGSSSPRQIMFLNEFPNRYIFALAKHKKLLMDLLVVSSPNHFTKYTWTKAKSKTESSVPLLTELVKEMYNYSTNRAAESLPLLDDDTLLDMALDLGRQPSEIKGIKKELKTRKYND